MPAAAEDRLLEYARMWRERGIRSWGEGWWEMPLTVGDQIARLVGGLGRDAPERDRRRDGRDLVLPESRPAQPRRLRAGELPVGQVPLPVAAGARGRRGRGRPGDRRRDRRAYAARADQPRSVQ